MTNEELVSRIQSGEDVRENMLELYNQVKAFIHSIAWKYRDSGMVEDLELLERVRKRVATSQQKEESECREWS